MMHTSDGANEGGGGGGGGGGAPPPAGAAARSGAFLEYKMMTQQQHQEQLLQQHHHQRRLPMSHSAPVAASHGGSRVSGVVLRAGDEKDVSQRAISPPHHRTSRAPSHRIDITMMMMLPQSKARKKKLTFLAPLSFFVARRAFFELLSLTCL